MLSPSTWGNLTLACAPISSKAITEIIKNFLTMLCFVEFDCNITKKSLSLQLI
jgi:hypothetical protein